MCPPSPCADACACAQAWLRLCGPTSCARLASALARRHPLPALRLASPRPRGNRRLRMFNRAFSAASMAPRAWQALMSGLGTQRCLHRSPRSPTPPRTAAAPCTLCSPQPRQGGEPLGRCLAHALPRASHHGVLLAPIVVHGPAAVHWPVAHAVAACRAACIGRTPSLAIPSPHTLLCEAHTKRPAPPTLRRRPHLLPPRAPRAARAQPQRLCLLHRAAAPALNPSHWRVVSAPLTFQTWYLSVCKRRGRSACPSPRRFTANHAHTALHVLHQALRRPASGCTAASAAQCNRHWPACLHFASPPPFSTHACLCNATNVSKCCPSVHPHLTVPCAVAPSLAALEQKILPPWDHLQTAGHLCLHWSTLPGAANSVPPCCRGSCGPAATLRPGPRTHDKAYMLLRPRLL